MIRGLVALIGSLLLTLCFGLTGIVFSLVNPRGEWIFRLGKGWARSICSVSGVSVEVQAAEHAPRGAPAILVANHQSNFDILAILIAMPVPVRFVAKRLLFRIPVFGWCLSLAGMIPIDRERRASAIRSLDAAAERIREGHPVLFFPEGTRSSDGRLLPFKKGAFVIALKSGIPIVPVSIAGGVEVLRKGSLRIRPGKIVLRWNEALGTAGRGPDARDALLERARRAILSGLAEIDPSLYGPGGTRYEPTTPPGGA